MNILTETFSHSPWLIAMGWTLLHSLWQGALIAGLLALLLKQSSHQVPQLRYALSSAALALMLVFAGWTFHRSYQVSAAESGPTLPTALNNNEASWAATPFYLEESPSTESSFSIAPRLEAALPWLSMLWLVGILLFSLRVIGGWWYSIQLRRMSTASIPPEWIEMTQRLANQLHLSQVPQLLGSLRIHSPMVLGAVKPVILLPVSLLAGMSPSQVESILAHELAHIQRHDYLFNWLQTVVETLFFFHPAVWWMSKQIREERELCCDDVAVGLGKDSIGYAKALADMEQYRLQTPALAVALEGNGSLSQRIRRIVQLEQEPRSSSNHLIVALIMTLTVGMLLATLPKGEKGMEFPLAQATFTQWLPGEVQSWVPQSAEGLAAAPGPASISQPLLAVANPLPSAMEHSPLPAIEQLASLPDLWVISSLNDTPPPPPPAPPSMPAAPAQPSLPTMPAMPALPPMPAMPATNFAAMDSLQLKEFHLQMEAFGDFQESWQKEMAQWSEEVERWAAEYSQQQTEWESQAAHLKELEKTYAKEQLERRLEELAAKETTEANRERARILAEAKQAEREQQRAVIEMQRMQQELKRMEMMIQQEHAVQQRQLELEMKQQMAQLEAEQQRMKAEEQRMQAEVALMEAEYERMADQFEALKEVLIPELKEDGLLRSGADAITIKTKRSGLTVNGTKLTKEQEKKYRELMEKYEVKLGPESTLRFKLKD